MTRKDYIPDTPRQQRDWSQNFISQFPAISTRVGWTEADATALTERVTKLQGAAQAVIDADAARDIALGQFEAVRTVEVSEVRLDIGNLKKTRGFTEGDARSLGVMAASSSFDPANCEPKLLLEEKRGRVQLMAKKLGADSLNLYVRRKGESNFRLLMGKRARFPFDDTTQPEIAGHPEEREYQAVAVVGDDEVGRPSAIVSGVWRP